MAVMERLLSGVVSNYNVFYRQLIFKNFKKMFCLSDINMYILAQMVKYLPAMLETRVRSL